MQLAASLEVHGRSVVVGLPAVTYVAADTELNAAAMAEGVTASVHEPRGHGCMTMSPPSWNA
jgi:hypothetical protein